MKNEPMTKMKNEISIELKNERQNETKNEMKQGMQKKNEGDDERSAWRSFVCF